MPQTSFRLGIAAVALAALVLSGCSTTEAVLTRPVPSESAATVSLPALADVLNSSEGLLTTGIDRIEVWVCSVPLDTQAPDYQPSTLRLDLDPATLSDLLEETVPAYFATLSAGAYTPEFVAGGSLIMQPAETPADCLDRALDKSKSDSSAVMAVATAEHRADSHGGFGFTGATCESLCSAKATRRGLYVGASDFHPDWGPVPALDLTEHEIGHMLGWPHSGDLTSWYASDLDVMSNSAAPRGVDSAARNGGATLGINRVAAGWLPPDDVVVTPSGIKTTEVTLSPSTGTTGPRLLALPVDRYRFLTVELLNASGLNVHLPREGLTITLVDQSPNLCGTPCDPLTRTQQTLVGDAPFTALLTPTSPVWEHYGWRVQVTELSSESATLQVSAIAP